MPARRLRRDDDIEASLQDLTERPDLRGAVDRLVAENMPPFLTWASPGNWRWHRLYSRLAAYQVVVVGPGDELLAAMHSVPLSWNGDLAGLPGGYDDAVVSATADDAGDDANVTCLLSISIARDRRKGGLAERLIAEAKTRARARGHVAVLGPLRPTRKAEFPDVPMAEYLQWRDARGEVFDPWLRLHLELGARILRVAERSLVVRQPASRWEGLTGRGAMEPGAHRIEGALALVTIGADGVGEYAEPNIWISHDLAPPGAGVSGEATH